MDQYTTESAPEIHIRSLLKDKRVRTALVVVAVVLFIVWLVKGLLGSMMGVGGVSTNNELYAPYAVQSDSYKGGVASAPRIAMDSNESYYPVPTEPSGGTGSYDETEYETRSYSATIKTGDYDTVLGVIESWKPRPYVMFEEAVKGERTSYYRLKVESASADEVLKALNELSPTDLSQQTEVVKKQLLDYTTRLDVLTKQETLLSDMLQTVNDAYDELVVLSKDAKDVKTLASVIDDKLKYINQLTQQRLNVSNQIDSIARQKAELADRIAYVYFTISVTKYEFINADQIKDSWVARTQTFVRETNTLLQTMTLGLIGLLLWLLQALLYVLIIGTVALFVAKHGYRTVIKYWQS